MAEHYDIVVLGAGPGGYVAALRAAQLGAKVAVVEQGHLGGACLNVGCIPSKALLASAELLHRISRAGEMGINAGQVSFDWPAIQARKDKVIATLRGGIKHLFGSRGVTLASGRGMIAGPGRIAVASGAGTREITSGKTILATGSSPARIPGWPSDPQIISTSDEALHWKTLPKRLLIVGGGVIGCEFACMMAQYGVAVTVVEMLGSLLPEMEPQLGQVLEPIFAKRGIRCLTKSKVEELTVANGAVKATISGGQNIEVDHVLVATGRRPNTAGIGLESIGLQTDRGFVRVNDQMETAVAGYYCIGDANGRCLLAHAASAHGETAVENALGHPRHFDLPVPLAVYTFPEIAAVGMTSTAARDKGIAVSVGHFPIGHLGKAMAVGETDGFVKVIRRRDDGEVLGVHMMGHNVTEIIASATAFLGTRAKAADIAQSVFAHPTISESFKEAAEDSLGAAIHLAPRKTIQVAVGDK